VYYTVLGDDTQKATTLNGLKQAAGFLRNELFHRIKLHTIPQLHFEYDESLERGLHLSQLIHQANQSTAQEEKDE
jgi:ribosome-binding factor A